MKTSRHNAIEIWGKILEEYDKHTSLPINNSEVEQYAKLVIEETSEQFDKEKADLIFNDTPKDLVRQIIIRTENERLIESAVDLPHFIEMKIKHLERSESVLEDFKKETSKIPSVLDGLRYFSSEMRKIIVAWSLTIDNLTNLFVKETISPFESWGQLRTAAIKGKGTRNVASNFLNQHRKPNSTDLTQFKKELEDFFKTI